MTPDQWARINSLFHAALEHAPDVRADWLARNAADDEIVRQEVEALLAAHARSPEFLEAGAALDAARAVDFGRLAFDSAGTTSADAGVDAAAAAARADTDAAADASGVESVEASRRAASLVGRQLGGYEVTRELGRGGMAIVYLAHDPRLQRDVAIKVVRGSGSGGGSDIARRERLRREARAVALLDHPGIATIHALEEHGDELYIVTEYVRGETLREELGRGPLASDRLRDTVISITRVIAAAHAKGIIHRDLKPENVMRTPSGEIKILDFGLARASGSAAGEIAPTLTHAGGLLGTPAYMAPEQIREGQTDERADIFALGVMFYELAYGAHPFGRGSIATLLHRIAWEEPISFSEHAPRIDWIEPILERCLAKDPAERYGNAGELLQALLAQTSATASAPVSVSVSASAATPASASVPAPAASAEPAETAKLGELVAPAAAVGSVVNPDVDAATVASAERVSTSRPPTGAASEFVSAPLFGTAAGPQSQFPSASGAEAEEPVQARERALGPGPVAEARPAPGREREPESGPLARRREPEWERDATRARPAARRAISGAGPALAATSASASAITPPPTSTMSSFGAQTPRTSAETRAATSEWWWQFHQLSALAFLALAVIPAWRTWEWIAPDLLRELIRLLTVVGAATGASLRLHVWFLSRYDPSGLREQRPRTGRWIRLADWAFTLALLAGALAILPTRSPYGATFVVLSVCYAVAFLVVEPATARAAFRPRELNR